MPSRSSPGPVPARQRTTRRPHRLRAAVLLALGGGLIAPASAGWDCRPLPDGGWDCRGVAAPAPQPEPASAGGDAARTTPLAAAPAREGVTETPAPTVPKAAPGRPEPRPDPRFVVTPPEQDATLPRPATSTDEAASGAAARPAAVAMPDHPDSEAAPDPRFVVAPPEQDATPPHTATSTDETASGAAARPAAVAVPDHPDSEAAPDPRFVVAPPEQDATPPHTAPAARSAGEAATPAAPAECPRPARVAVAAPAADTGPLEAEADHAEALFEQQRIALEGGVRLRRGALRIEAGRVALDQRSGALEASGDVRLQRPDLTLTAERIEYNIETGLGRAERAGYRLPGVLARGTAAEAELTGPGTGRYRDIRYTTCPAGNDDWVLSAARLELDTVEGLGTAHDARLAFLGVPLAWLPKLTFPIDDRRRSGLLVPSLSYGDRHGLDLALPYYLNLAPNYDLTLTPRLMSRRGVMLGAEFRFLTARHEGRIEASYLPDDRRANGRADSRRGSLGAWIRGDYGNGLSSALRINHVSDDNWLADFGADLSLTGRSHLERAVELAYADARWSILGRLQEYQTIDPTLTLAQQPYKRLPQVLVRGRDRLTAGGLVVDAALDAEYVDFRKSDGALEGRRIDLHPRLSLPFGTPFYHLEPTLGLRYTAYRLRNTAPGADDSPDRLTPILSLDGQLHFDRPLRWFGRDATQTLEPRLFYLYVPREDQRALPVFDTTAQDFGFDALFRDNRFTGADRQGDANRLALALTSRIEDDASGRELLRASIGQILYFEDRRVTLPGQVAGTDDTSAVAAELSARLGAGWRGSGALLWNPNTDIVEQALARLGYRGRDGRVVTATYRLRDTLSTHADLGVIWPLGERTRAIARWNWSISEQRNLDALAGIEYGRCCWRLRALVRQQVSGTGDGQNLSFLLQLELNGLGSLGDDIDALLNEGIYGYRRNDE